MKRNRRSLHSTSRFRFFRAKSGQSNSAPGPKARRLQIILGIILAVFIGMSIFLYRISLDMPSLTRLERIDPEMATQVYSADGEIIHSFFTFNRTFTPLEKIPPCVTDALLSSEDREFYDHWGINLMGIVRALLVDIMHLELKQGSSTISMQLARNLYFGFEKKLTRKIKEALTAIQIERTYSKTEILEMYLNINSFGNNAFGIEAAARRYFNKKVEELNVADAAMLIGLLKGQTYYSPFRYPERAKQRRNVVLSMMKDFGKISPSEYNTLKDTEISLQPKDPHEMKIAPYFTEYVRLQVNKLQDSLGVDVYEDGLRVYTTLNTKLQRYMDLAIERQIGELQDRVRKQSVFLRMKRTLSDSLYDAISTMQIAFITIDPHTGQILAMTGGRDFKKSRYNRAVQMARQPGSSFKPILYTSAIDNGFTPIDLYRDLPTVELNPDGTRWTPENYEGEFSGELLALREAIRHSKNSVAVKLITDITPQVVVQYARNMGITTPLEAYSSLALGSFDVIPLEMISAYGIFANNGVLVKPVSILKIEDRGGNVIYQARAESREVLSPATTCIMNQLLQDVVNRGTGAGARSLFKFYEPAGGKTGTTNDNSNAWFIGFTPNLVAGVWVGLDDFKYNLGGGMTGSAAALPFWADFMKTAYDSAAVAPDVFPPCPDVVYLKVCNKSKKLATEFCPDTYDEIFNIKYQPKEFCDLHSGQQQIIRTKKKRF
jgi:penicillin-binding protein 1A